MVNYIYKGYGITNENGIAKLEFDENGDPIDHSYIGVGAGEIDFVASLDNPITSGSLVSETSVYDCLFYESFTTTPVEVYRSGNAEISTDSTGTTIDNSESTSAQYYFMNYPNTSKSSWRELFDWSAPLKVEVDIIEYSGNDVNIYCRESSHNESSKVLSTGTKTVTASSIVNGAIGFQIGAGCSVKFKDFRIYPI